MEVPTNSIAKAKSGKPQVHDHEKLEGKTDMATLEKVSNGKRLRDSVVAFLDYLLLKRP